MSGRRQGDPSQPIGDQKALGRAIKALREQQTGLTPELLARRAEVNSQRVERVEAGEGDANYNTVVFLVRAIGATMREFTELHETFVKEEGQGSAKA
jgi:predicted transcriptional regulator